MQGFLDFLVDIISVPAVITGVAALVGNIALKKGFGATVQSSLKAIIGFLVLGGGAGILIGALDALGPMFTEGFGITGVVPTNEAIGAVAFAELGQATATIMVLGFVFNIIFAYITPFKYIFLTGHHSLFMAALLAVSLTTLGMSGWIMWLLGAVLLGLLEVLMPAWAQGVSTKVSGTEEWTIGHFNTLGYWLAGLAGRLGGDSKSTEEIEFPAALSFLKDSMVANGVVMFVVFLVTALAAGGGWVMENLSGGQHWLVYILVQALTFAAGVGVVIYGVRLILAEVIPSFKGIADKVIPAAKPAFDIPIVFPYAENAVMIGFLSSFVAGLLSMLALGALGLPVIIPGLIPHFFLGAGTGVIGNAYGGTRGAILGAFVNGVLISFGAAFVLPSMASLGFQNTTFGDADFQWVGIVISLIGRVLGVGG